MDNTVLSLSKVDELLTRAGHTAPAALLAMLAEARELVEKLLTDTGRADLADLAAVRTAARNAARAPTGATAPSDYADFLIHSSLDMIISVDTHRRIIEFNPAAERVFGYAKSEVLGRPVDILYADPGRGARVSDEALRHGFSGEVRNRRKNGEIFYCLVSACPLRDSAGQVIGLMGISRDITVQKAAQEALRDAHDQLARLNRQLEEKVQSRTAALQQAYEETLAALVLAVDSRERATGGHSRRVAMCCLYVALEVGYPEAGLENLYRGALLHDIGKIAIPDSILLKPGKLTPDERRTIEAHVAIGVEFLRQVGYLRGALDIPRYHHEHFDGRGYLEGLRGEEIPLAARIFAVIDVYDALRSERPYKAAMSHTDALDIIRTESGTHFDPELAARFIATPVEVWDRLAVESQQFERFADVLHACRLVPANRAGRTTP